jgi:hypothetical protein
MGRACASLVSDRTASAEVPTIREAGPIRVSTAHDLGTRWDAIAFTLLAGVGLIVAATNAPQWSRVLFARSGDVPRAPSTAAVPPPTPLPTLPPADALSSRWVSQSGYPGITVGGTATITVVFRNTGTAEWRRGTPSEIRLGIVGQFDPAMASGWPHPERPAVQSRSVVRPGELATFRFEVRGTRPGTFRLRLRPVVDGVAWLNDEGVYVDVDVRSPVGPPVDFASRHLRLGSAALLWPGPLALRITKY